MQRYCFTRDREHKFHSGVRLGKPMEEKSCFINECRRHGFVELRDSDINEHRDYDSKESNKAKQVRKI